MGENPNNVVNPPTDPQNVDPTILGPNGGTTNWQEKYVGLQRTYQELFNKEKELRLKYDQLVIDHGTVIAEKKQLEQDLTVEKGSSSSKDQSLTAKETELNSTKASLTRAKLIAKKYPALAELDEQGLFDGVKPEELEAKLESVNKSILDKASSTVVSNFQPAPPSQVAGGSTLDLHVPLTQNSSLEDLQDRIYALAGSKDPKDQAEFNRLNDFYMQQLNSSK